MGKLMIGGRHVGSSGTAKDMCLHACWRSDRERKLLGCDNHGEPPLAADEAARRRRRLNYDEITKPVPLRGIVRDDEQREAEFRAYLVELGLSTEDIAKACALAFGSDNDSDTSAVESGGAFDSRFPHADRLVRNNGRGEASSSGLDHPSSTRSVSITNAAVMDENRRREMFPHADRLKA